MKTIKQKHIIHATPQEVYAAITNSFTIELWSGYPAVMEAKEGFEFSLFDGDISGKNLKLVENEMLVQNWYFGEITEDSVVTINIMPHEHGTRVTVEHTNIPDEDVAEFEEGWKDYYWGAIKEFFR
jgi:activator of HSP90 ATPase